MGPEETLLRAHFEKCQERYMQEYNGQGILYLHFDDSGVVQQGHYSCMESFRKKHPNPGRESHLVIDLQDELTEHERNTLRF